MTLHVIFTYLSILQPQMILIFTLPQQLYLIAVIIVKEKHCTKRAPVHNERDFYYLYEQRGQTAIVYFTLQIILYNVYPCV